MPISDAVGYPLGHFKLVYDFIIKPACKLAGFSPIRADDIKGTNVIVIDILRRILDSEMALCDLSAKNPNVLYELGIRQSFDLPVTFIKDDITDRIFDIQGFRDIPYAISLRVDEVGAAINAIATSLKETYDNKGKEVNSIIELLGISKATLKEPVSLSTETAVLLDALNEIRERITNLSPEPKQSIDTPILTEVVVNPYWDYDPSLEMINSNTQLAEGDLVEHRKFGTGQIKRLEINGSEKKLTIKFLQNGEKVLLLAFAKLKRKKQASTIATAP